MQIERGLDKLLHGQYDEALEAFCPSSTSSQAEKLCQITKALAEVKSYAAELAKGNLPFLRLGLQTLLPPNSKRCT